MYFSMVRSDHIYTIAYRDSVICVLKVSSAYRESVICVLKVSSAMASWMVPGKVTKVG